MCEVHLSLTKNGRRISPAQFIERECHGAALARRVGAILVDNPIERVVMTEEEIPVGGKEPVEGDHFAGRGTREDAARGGLSVTLGNGTPCALPHVIHVRLKVLLEPRVIGEEGGGVIFRSALSSIEEAMEAHRIARGVEGAVVVVTLAGANREDDAASLDVERLEASIDRDAIAIVARRSDPERTSRIERPTAHAMDVVRRARGRQAMPARDHAAAAATAAATFSAATLRANVSGASASGSLSPARIFASVSRR